MACSTCAGSGAPCWIRGDDVTLTFDFMGADVTPEDVVLFTVKRTLDDDPTDGRAVVRADGELQEDGTVTVTVPGSVTATIPPGDYWWDLRILREGSESTHTRPATLCIHRPVTNRGA